MRRSAERPVACAWQPAFATHDLVMSGGSTAMSQMPPAILNVSRLGRQSGGVTGVSPRSTVGHAATVASNARSDDGTRSWRMPRLMLSKTSYRGKLASAPQHHGPTAVGEESIDIDSEAPVSASADTPTSNSLPLTEPWQPAQTWSNIACGTPIEMISPGPNWCSSLIWKSVEPPLARLR